MTLHTSRHPDFTGFAGFTGFAVFLDLLVLPEFTAFVGLTGFAGFTGFGRRHGRVDLLEDVVEGIAAQVIRSATLPIATVISIPNSPRLGLAEEEGGVQGADGFSGSLRGEVRILLGPRSQSCRNSQVQCDPIYSIILYI
jgi:hypothetical protein